MAKKRFSQFLAETKTSWELSDFSHILHSAAESEQRDESKMSQYISRLIEQLRAAQAAAAVPNPEFQTIKSNLSRVVEYATSLTAGAPHTVIDAIRSQQRDGQRFNDWDWNIAAAIHVPGKLAKAEVAAKSNTHPVGKIFFTWFLPTLRELTPLVQAVDSLKDKVFKRQPKPVETQAQRFQNAGLMAAQRKSGPAVTKVLTDLTDGIKDGYAKRIADDLISQAERINNMSDEDYKKATNSSRVRTPQIMSVFRAIWEDKTATKAYQYNPHARLTLKSGYKEVLVKAGKDQAEHMQQEFLIKNVTKLVTIVDAKGNLEGAPKILATDPRSFQGDIEFRFADKSRFVVRNQVVIKSNQYGTVFNQFPTTFHDVIMPDGKPMGQPSEERMNAIFTKA